MSVETVQSTPESLLMGMKDDIPFDERWDRMKPVIQRLLSLEDVPREEWHQLFWDVFASIQWDPDGSERLQTALTTLVCERFKKIRLALEEIKEKDSSNYLELMEHYRREWDDFESQLAYIPEPFRALEIEFLERTDEELSIEFLLLLEWKFMFRSFESELRAGAKHLIYEERCGNTEYKHDARVQALKMTYVHFGRKQLISTSSPAKGLELKWDQFYYKDRRDFYVKRVADKLAEEPTAIEYMSFALDVYNFERKMTKQYIAEASFKKSQDELLEVLVNEPAASELILTSIDSIVNALDKEALRIAFILMRPDVDKSRALRKAVNQYVIKKGTERLKACSLTDGDAAVSCVLKLYEETDMLIEYAFMSHFKFTTERDRGFNELLNSADIFGEENKFPEMLATHVDGLLRKKALCRKYNEQEIEERLFGIINLLKYIDSKDLFMRHHKLHLTRRLVLNVSNDLQLEENFVDGLRAIGMPSEYVNKLQRMFQDIKLSEGLSKDVKAMLKKDSINVKVLSAGAWVRGLSRFPIQLPHQVEDSLNSIESYYKEQHTGRKLSFHPLLSHGTMTFESKVGKYELDVTAVQMAVLSCWNRRANSELTIQELCLGSLLPESDLKKTLTSLTMNPKLKIQLVLTRPQVTKVAKEFTAGMTFRVNRAFALIKSGKAATRGKVSLIGRLPLTAEKASKKEDDEIFQLRTLRVQEAALKVLKARRRVDAATLSSELTELLKSQFLPTMKMIKEQLEWIIEQGFAERDPKAKEIFVYKA
ncbi:unnamed protein product [Oikopleura dioica]|uniref:Cullin family profile domain-containing protein n=1 Tax=Oikopleura dioica TaxID=34765 RepID=E4YZ62_OIKDI|nr:unnamed protein product [Oikopleura dioica]